VVAATRGLDRGRVGQDAVDAAYDQDLTDWITVEKEAGLDFFSDGLLRWQDIFRPLADGLGAKKAEELVRWFDTNTFYRAPEIESLDHPQVDAVKPASSVPTPRVVTLPSPFVFSRATHQSTDRNRLMQEIAEKLLRPAIETAVAAEAKVIHLEEPWLTYYGIEPGDWKPFERSLAVLKGSSAAVILHCYFGDAGPYIEQLLKLPVDGIGVDLMETDVGELGTSWRDKSLLIGCMNGRSSVLEPAEEIVELTQRIADTIAPRNLYLSSNCELQYLPTGVAENKVRRLGEVARKARELVKV
jgi:5-methyltetrahydropteroyltriglutamate--homocysteine methyltransferase